jgi:plastocyanin
MLLVMPVLAACSSQPAASASTQPASSASTQPANSAPASEPPTGNIQISAKNLNFEPDSAEIPAGTAFKIDFDNEDSATVHDIDIHLSNPGGEVVFDGATLAGPASATYDVPALAAGTYAFVCSVHAEMQGTMNAK